MSVVLIVEDESSETDQRLRLLCAALSAPVRTMPAAEALAEVATSDVSLILLGDSPRGMCFHEVAAAVAQLCQRLGTPAPTVLRMSVEVLLEAVDGTTSATPGAAPPPGSGPAEPAPLDIGVLATLESDIGDRGFVVDTIEVYLAELPDRVAAICRSLLEGDARGVKAVAHSLKSSSAMLGAIPLSEVCAQLEATAAAGGHFPDPAGQADHLTTRANDAANALRNYAAS
jgi:HPt (histidine-containing phosphotransfer) domain-containing protein